MLNSLKRVILFSSILLVASVASAQKAKESSAMSGSGSRVAATPTVQFKKLPIQLTHKKHSRTITIEIAESAEETSHGMMYRQSLKPDEGMLFIFSRPRVLSFWMKNTFVDLDIGFFDDKKVLVDIQQMAATSMMQTDFPNYISKVPAQYALEMPKGWFERNKFPVGTRLQIPRP